jgi:hypothetical protein
VVCAAADGGMILERQPVILNDPLGGFWPRVLTRRSVGRSAWPQKKEHHISRPAAAAAAAYLNWFCDFGGQPRNRSSPFFRFSSPVASLFATAFGSNSISQRKNVMRVYVYSLKEREIYAILINTLVYCRCRNTHTYTMMVLCLLEKSSRCGKCVFYCRLK